MNINRGILLFVASQSCFVIESAIVHYLGAKTTFDQLTFIRSAGCVILILFLARREGIKVLKTDHLMMQMFRGLLTVISLWMIFYSLARLPLPDVTAISYLRPVFIAFYGVMLLGEAISPQRYVSIAICFFGALIVIGPAFIELDLVYGIAALGAAINAGAVAATRVLGRHDRPTTILTYMTVVSLVFSITGLAQPWPWEDLLALAGVALSGAMGLWLGVIAINETEVSLLAPYDYVRLPLSMLLALVVFSEIPSLLTLTGSTFILLSGAILFMRERRRPPAA